MLPSHLFPRGTGEVGVMRLEQFAKEKKQWGIDSFLWPTWLRAKFADFPLEDRGLLSKHLSRWHSQGWPKISAHFPVQKSRQGTVIFLMLCGSQEQGAEYHVAVELENSQYCREQREEEALWVSDKEDGKPLYSTPILTITAVSEYRNFLKSLDTVRGFLWTKSRETQSSSCF